MSNLNKLCSFWKLHLFCLIILAKSQFVLSVKRTITPGLPKKCPSSETVAFLKKCLRSLGASAVNSAENSDKWRYWPTFIIPAFSLVQVRLFCHLIGSSSSLLPPHWSKFFSLAIPLVFIITGHCCVFFFKNAIDLGPSKLTLILSFWATDCLEI